MSLIGDSPSSRSESQRRPNWRAASARPGGATDGCSQKPARGTPRISESRCLMNVRIEEWLDQMRQAHEPGPLVRVIVVRSGRTESWTFDVTEKTDLEDLAE